MTDAKHEAPAEPCFECGSTERIGSACKPCNPEITDTNFGHEAPGHSALIERLEERVAYDKRHFTVDPLHAEAAAALRDLTEWRDIATAPETGPILLWDADNHEPVVSDLRGQENSWWLGYWEVLVRATHWLPLPSAPNQAKEAGE